MIEYREGDMFAFAAEAEALVNPVNCVGVMGRGIALQCKRMYPENFKAYSSACKRGEVQPGRMFVFDTGQMTNPRYIVNFPTKRHWRGKSRMEDIDAGLEALATEIRSRGIQSVILPPLGSGLGGLDWSDVRPRIEGMLRPLDDVKAIVYEPSGSPTDAKANRSTDVPHMTPARAVVVSLMDRYLQGLLDPLVTLLEVHKLTYFTQAAGEQLRLRFAKGHYGPYAENLRHVFNAIEGHLVVGYADGGDVPGKPLALVPGALADAEAALISRSETRDRLRSVFQLVEGFESPFGMELLATVHWVVTEEGARTTDEIVDRTYGWGQHKAKFSHRQIGIAQDVLETQGWILP